MHLWVRPVCICSLFATTLHKQSLYNELGQENNEILGMTREKQRKKIPIQIQKPRFWPWEDQTDTDIHTILETNTQIQKG